MYLLHKKYIYIYFLVIHNDKVCRFLYSRYIDSARSQITKNGQTRPRTETFHYTSQTDAVRKKPVLSNDNNFALLARDIFSRALPCCSSSAPFSLSEKWSALRALMGNQHSSHESRLRSQSLTPAILSMLLAKSTSFLSPNPRTRLRQSRPCLSQQLIRFSSRNSISTSLRSPSHVFVS